MTYWFTLYVARLVSARAWIASVSHINHIPEYIVTGFFYGITAAYLCGKRMDGLLRHFVHLLFVRIVHVMYHTFYHMARLCHDAMLMLVMSTRFLVSNVRI